MALISLKTHLCYSEYESICLRFSVVQYYILTLGIDLIHKVNRLALFAGSFILIS